MKYKWDHKADKLIFNVNYLFLMKTWLKTDMGLWTHLSCLKASITFIKSWFLYPALYKTEYYDTHLQTGKSKVQVQYPLHSDFKIAVSYKKHSQKK